MKYMGSKRIMLQNGLGDLICERANEAKRIVDLFCGAGIVAWYAAENTTRPVYAVDLQTYAEVLAKAVVERDYSINPSQLEIRWLSIVETERQNCHLWDKAAFIERTSNDVRDLVFRSRVLCEEDCSVGPVWNAYGGYYFSPTQALTFDYMLQLLPQSEPERSVCLAAAILSASKCAAAPGHTAQPFQPTERASRFIADAWRFDPVQPAKTSLFDVCLRHARSPGKAFVADALDVASTLKPSDLVIIDPPYSGVHYSRFYHVLETIARGYCSSVHGTGRYPPIDERPRSDFSMKSRSQVALRNLIALLASVGACVIFTFPARECSNGLSGELVIEIVNNWYDVDVRLVEGYFSTLGGNNSARASRRKSEELLLYLKPK